MGEIRIYPDPILIKRAQPVKNIDGKVKEIADRMTEVMYANKGIGLAAPQVGILSRIFIVDVGEGCKMRRWSEGG
jgi:peptide deformylase